MHQSLARMPLCPIPAEVQDQAKHISIIPSSQFLLANLLLIRNLMADSCANCFGASVNIYQSAPIIFVTISAEASKARPSPASTYMSSRSLRFAISGPVPDHCLEKGCILGVFQNTLRCILPIDIDAAG